MFSAIIAPSILAWCPMMNFGCAGTLKNWHNNLTNRTVGCRPSLKLHTNVWSFL